MATILAAILPIIVSIIVNRVPLPGDLDTIGRPVVSLAFAGAASFALLLATCLFWRERMQRFQGLPVGNSRAPVDQGRRLQTLSDPQRLSFVAYNEAQRLSGFEGQTRFYSFDRIIVAERRVVRMGTDVVPYFALAGTFVSQAVLLAATAVFLLGSPNPEVLFDPIRQVTIDGDNISASLSELGVFVIVAGNSLLSWLLWPALLALFGTRLGWLAMTFVSERRYRSLLFSLEAPYIQARPVEIETEHGAKDADKESYKGQVAERYGSLITYAADIESVVFPTLGTESVSWPRQVSVFAAADDSLQSYLEGVERELESAASRMGGQKVEEPKLISGPMPSAFEQLHDEPSTG